MGLGELENRLNELSGSEWLYWTNTIYETSFPPDCTHNFRKMHGAMKPPEFMAEIVSFFSKSGETILDPFAGVGGTLLGAELVNRKALGMELNPCWVAVYQNICREFKISKGSLVTSEEAGQAIGSQMLLGDCFTLMTDIDENSIAAIITDPPYGCHHGATGFKAETHFNMESVDPRDIGNSRDYHEYLHKMRVFGAEAYRVLRNRRYLVMLIGDRLFEGEYLPLGFKVAEVLREVGFKWKGIRIWWNKATQRPLRPYAVKACFIPNITHQTLIIMRKETVPKGKMKQTKSG